MASFPCPISGDFDCADDCCVAPPRRRCPRMFDRAFAAMEKPRSLEASRRIATGVGHVRDAPAHFWPHAKGQGHLGVKLSNTDRANGAELARRIGLGEFTACQALHRLTEGAMNKSGVRNGPERPTLALKWSAHCADAESRVRPLRAFLAVLACDELNIDLDRAEKRARSLSGSDLTAFSLGTEADDDEPALFATSVDYGRADQAGLAAMIDEDDAMEAEPRRDGKRVRRASLGEAQVSLAISGLGS